jgi:Sodium/calcium exchanger protein
MLRDHLPLWTWLSPFAGWLLLAGSLMLIHPLFVLVLGAGLVACVLAAVHHAEVVAHRVGEPFGTLVLALAVTVIEVALIVSLMLASGDAATALARDTIFAAIMIILNGMVGLCLLVGGVKARRAGIRSLRCQRSAGDAGDHGCHYPHTAQYHDNHRGTDVFSEPACADRGRVARSLRFLRARTDDPTPRLFSASRSCGA